MVSREIRAYLTGLVLAVGVGIVGGFVFGPASYDTLQGALVGLLVFPVLSFLTPQLYLAAVGSESEDVPPRTRIRVGLFVSGLVVLGMRGAASAGTVGQSLLTASAALLLGTLVVHEMVVGYRSSSLFEDGSAE